MELKITNCNNLFEMKGALTKSNLEVFQNEFKNIFEKVNALTIGIEGIEWMDRDGVNALAKLYKESIIKNKKLSIVGLGCKDLYNHFKSDAAA